MKQGTTESVKFLRLIKRLRETKRGIVGLLELLWLTTAKNTPQGDIGRLTNEEIAVLIDWDGNPDDLIVALVESGWLDVCERHRLVVHDWPDHCPTYIKGNLKNAAKDFARPSMGGLSGDLVPDIVGSTKPNLTKPNLTKPISSAVADGTIQEFVEAFQSVRGVSRIRTLTESRRDKLRKRLADPAWPWREALAKLPIPGDGWQPDFDWIVANADNVLKIIEGKYDWRIKTSANGHSRGQTPGGKEYAPATL